MRGDWQGREGGDADDIMAMRLSGGEDVLGAARSIERVRANEGSVSEFERYSMKPGGSGGQRQQQLQQQQQQQQYFAPPPDYKNIR